ncbi:MAG: hypothetical protein HYU68_14935 [Bacteroidetes bacterium]|nr:hypothetical protein [Bacteroidota bacterium]
MKYTTMTDTILTLVKKTDPIFEELQDWLNYGWAKNDKNEISSKIVSLISEWQKEVENELEKNEFLIEKMRFSNILNGHFQYIFNPINSRAGFDNQIQIFKAAKSELLNICATLESKNEKKTITQVFIEDIDNFKPLAEKVKAEHIASKYAKSAFLEDDIEETFLKILNEPFKELDSAAETRDLSTDKVTINGKRIASVWMFKGRAVRGSLKIKDCGARADQLLKLSKNSFAQLFVIQHGHKIEPEVIEALRDHILAHALTHDIKILVIDGTDTARILKAAGQDLEKLMAKKSKPSKKKKK